MRWCQKGRSNRVDEELFRTASAAAKGFAENPDGWLVLDGTAGAGKTHLAAAIVNAIVERGDPAKYVSALDIPDLIRNERFEDDDGAEGGSFASLIDAPVLVIDDLGAQQATNWIDWKLDQLLTHRFNGQLPTVIVLAKPIWEVPERVALKLDDPILSKVIELTSGDRARVNIPRPMLKRMTFETFDANGAPSSTHNDKASLSVALAAAREFAKQPDRWLFLHGPTGVGKTHLAVAISSAMQNSGSEVMFWPVPELLDRLRRTYSASSETDFYEIFDAVRNADTLVLDEFGQPNPTDWVLEKLYQLVRYRHDRRMPTVITSQFILWPGADNSEWLSVKDRLLWESICSRLSDSSVVTERLMAAPDYRNRGA